ncbi:glycosyltransferase family 50 protein, partial [Flagelloscypha sp. PMI_526]
MNLQHVPQFSTILAISVAIRVALIVYSEWHDSHSAVKYTDVDYRVFTDASNFLLAPTDGNRAQGVLAPFFILGDPYTRATYRYTPLLALFMSPTAIFPSFGKYIFALCDILCGIIMRRILLSKVLPHTSTATTRDRLATLYSSLYLLNPLVFSISTRGSSEAILSLAVLLTLNAALHENWTLAALFLGFSTHWKIYPFIYGVPCLVAIHSSSKETSFLRSCVHGRAMRFAVMSSLAFISLAALCFSFWGPPFLDHTYLYHLGRRDHRHNFSPYFYLTYLTYPDPGSGSVPPEYISGLLAFRVDLVFTWFIQTSVFVLFNKVCTSQYFLWYMHFLPLIAPRLSLSAKSSAILFIGWFASQGLWLADAYRLEFLGEMVFMGLWARSLIYVLSHGTILVILLRFYNVSDQPEELNPTKIENETSTLKHGSSSRTKT